MEKSEKTVTKRKPRATKQVKKPKVVDPTLRTLTIQQWIDELKNGVELNDIKPVDFE